MRDENGSRKRRKGEESGEGVEDAEVRDEDVPRQTRGVWKESERRGNRGSGVRSGRKRRRGCGPLAQTGEIESFLILASKSP